MLRRTWLQGVTAALGQHFIFAQGKPDSNIVQPSKVFQLLDVLSQSPGSSGSATAGWASKWRLQDVAVDGDFIFFLAAKGTSNVHCIGCADLSGNVQWTDTLPRGYYTTFTRTGSADFVVFRLDGAMGKPPGSFYTISKSSSSPRLRWITDVAPSRQIRCLNSSTYASVSSAAVSIFSLDGGSEPLYSLPLPPSAYVDVQRLSPVM